VEVPYGVRVATEWSWRFLVIAAAVGVLVYLVSRLSAIAVPLAIAILVTALVIPLTNGLARIVPRGLAAALTVITVLIVLSGLLTLVGQQIATGFADLADQVARGVEQIQQWLHTGPLGLTDQQLNMWFERIREAIGASGDLITQSAVRVGTTLGQVVTGFLLVLFITLFLLYQGEQIWAWVVRLFPRSARERADGAGRKAWVSLTAFVRATVLVALVDAVGIAIIALILRIPLAIPIGVLVFLSSFIPVVGAVVSGAVAVLVALVAQGPLIALVMLGGVLLVQQVESNVLQPLLMSRLVRLHPLAVVLAITAGAYLAGIAGALFAVPAVAVVNGIAGYLAGGSEEPVEETGSPGAGPAPPEGKGETGPSGTSEEPTGPEDAEPERPGGDAPHR